MDDAGEMLHYKHFASYDVNAIIVAAGAIMLGLLTVLVGFYPLNQTAELVAISPAAFSLTRMIMAGIVMAFAVIALLIRAITEAILLMLSGLSSLIFAISELTFGIAGFSLAYLFFTVAYLAGGLIFLSRGQMMLAAAALIMSATIVLSVFLNGTAYGLVFGCGMMVSGLLFLIDGLLNFAKIGLDRRVRKAARPVDRCSSVQYSQVVVSTAGILSFAILSLVMGYYVLDTSGNFLSLYVVKMILAVIVLAFGTYARSRGILAEGAMMFVLALSAFIFALTGILHIEGPVPLDFVMSFIFLVVAAEFVVKHDVLMSVTAVLLFLLLFLESFETLSEVLELVTVAVKMISGYLAITAWIYYDTGRDLRPRKKRSAEL